MSRVPDKPRRRTYKTGGRLPALTADWRPIPLGRDEQGDVDAQIRALAVLIRNRSDSSIYIREGPDTDDAFEIARGEDYKIWEPNGVGSLSMRGENGGEVAEVRTLEAHNDFDITDKVEAFARSIAHFIGTATSNTNISGQDVDLAIDDAGGISVVGDVDANLTGSNVDIPVTGDVDANIVNATLDVDASGSSITATIANSVLDIDGDVNITGQNDFDLSVKDRRGDTFKRTLRESNVSVDWPSWTPHTWTLYDPATSTYQIDSFTYMDTGESQGHTGFALEIDRGDTGSWSIVSPTRALTTANVKQYADEADPNVTIGAFESGERMSYTLTFPNGLVIEPGDSLRLRVRNDEKAASTTLNFVWLELQITEIERVNP